VQQHPHLGRMAPDYRLVMSTVNRVLGENYVTEPPVKPLKIAEAYGIAVLFAEFGDHKDVSGFFSWKKRTIFVNIEEAPNRQNFTIAHELGHYFLHQELFKEYPDEYQVLLRSPIGAAKDVLEKEANAFAANLLVPRNMLVQYANIASAHELAKLFNVSSDVIGFRRENDSRYAAA